TQPLPVKPAPYARQLVTEKDINPYAENRQALIDTLHKSRSEGPFTPLSERGTIIYPGLDGGGEWGGAAVDPDGIIYINSNEMAWRISLGPASSKEQNVSMSPGQSLYVANCTACHGTNRLGNPASGYPSLLDIGHRTKRDSVSNIISHGKGMMPAFPKFTEEQKKSLVGFLFGDEKAAPVPLREPGLNNKPKNDSEVSYSISGYSKFLDTNGLPAIHPPWGTLNAIDLNSGEYAWKVTFGEIPQLQGKGS